MNFVVNNVVGAVVHDSRWIKQQQQQQQQQQQLRTATSFVRTYKTKHNDNNNGNKRRFINCMNMNTNTNSWYNSHGTIVNPAFVNIQQQQQTTSLFHQRHSQRGYVHCHLLFQSFHPHNSNDDDNNNNNSRETITRSSSNSYSGITKGRRRSNNDYSTLPIKPKKQNDHSFSSKEDERTQRIVNTTTTTSTSTSTLKDNESLKKPTYRTNSLKTKQQQSVRFTDSSTTVTEFHFFVSKTNYEIIQWMYNRIHYLLYSSNTTRKEEDDKRRFRILLSNQSNVDDDWKQDDCTMQNTSTINTISFYEKTDRTVEYDPFKDWSSYDEKNFLQWISTREHPCIDYHCIDNSDNDDDDDEYQNKINNNNNKIRDDIILLFVQNFSKYRNVYVYTAAITALAQPLYNLYNNGKKNNPSFQQELQEQQQQQQQRSQRQFKPLLGSTTYVSKSKVLATVNTTPSQSPTSFKTKNIGNVVKRQWTKQYCIELLNEMDHYNIRPTSYTFTALFQCCKYFTSPPEPPPPPTTTTTSRTRTSIVNNGDEPTISTTSRSKYSAFTNSSSIHATTTSTGHIVLDLMIWLQKRYPDVQLTEQVYEAAIYSCCRGSYNHFDDNYSGSGIITSSSSSLSTSSTTTTETPETYNSIAQISDNIPMSQNYVSPWQAAEFLYKSMVKIRDKNELLPSERIVIALLDVCACDKKMKEAMALVSDLVMKYKSLCVNLNGKENNAFQPNDTTSTKTANKNSSGTICGSVLESPRFWGAVLKVCVACTSTENALKVLQMMAQCSVQSNIRHCTVFIKTLLNGSVLGNKDLVVAVDFLKYMALLSSPSMSSSLEISPERTITTTYDKLYHIFGSINVVEPDERLFKMVVRACASHGEVMLAIQLLRDFRDVTVVGTTTYAKFVDEECYHIILDSTKNNNPNLAKEVIRDMRSTRRYRSNVIPPNRISYTKAITVCRKAHDVPSALHFLYTARNDDGLEPDVYMYSAVIWTAAKAGDADTALKILVEMEEAKCTPTIVTYNGVLAALASCGRVEDAVYDVYLKHIVPAGLQPTYATYVHLAEAISTLNESYEEKLALLWRIYERMGPTERKVSVVGPILEALISSYGALGHYDEASVIFNSITGPSDAGCLRAIIFACSAADPPEWEEALDLLHSSDIFSETSSPYHVDSITLCHAMLACSKGSEWKESLNLLRLYGSRTNVSIVAMNSLIAACGRGGRPDMAMEVLNHEMYKYGLEPDVLSYRNAIIACNQAEHLEKKVAMKTRRAVQKTTLITLNDEEQDEEGDAFQRSATPTPTLTFEWWECAISLLRRMKENNIPPDTASLSSAISACEAAGQWRTALIVLQDMIDNIAETESPNNSSSTALNLYCFNAAISACEKGGAWVEALEIFERMKEYGGRELRPSIVTIGSIIESLDSAGQKDLAVTIYDEGVEMGIINPWRITQRSDGEKVKAIDLHRFSAAMTRAAIRSYMDGLLSTGKSKIFSVKDDLIIITGKGLRSESGRSILMPTVQSLLEEEYGITAPIDDVNTGRLVVSANELKDCISKKSWR